MTPSSFPIHQPPLWKQILRQNFNRLAPLADFLELTQAQRELLIEKPHFILNVPLRLAKKIAKGSIDDPLLKQFLPSIEENIKTDDFVSDPVGDCNFLKDRKLLQKYRGRVLLVCTSACAMHCRYCFRQNFDYETVSKGFDGELKIIEQDDSVHEVILSGGDPLSLSEDLLENLLQRLDLIPHVKRVRFHTRFPIGIPERIDERFLSALRALKKQIWFVVHVNHVRELDADIFDRFKELQRIGCTVLNQSVLLKGVNDSLESLCELCERLVDNGVLPYYLHQLDRVQGAAHFEVDEDEGRRLIREMAKVLPGYAVPKFVREIEGEPNKTPL